jgi:hypothetical protein
VSIRKYAALLLLAPALLVSRPLPAQTAQPVANGGDAENAAPDVVSDPEESVLADPEQPGAVTHKLSGARLIAYNLVHEKFDDLDSMASQYRSEKSRYVGGGWKLTAFYGALYAPHQTDKDTREHLEHLKHWIEQRPDSITARVALAASLHRWAWVARGNGMADTVTDEGWRLFNQRIEASLTVLKDAAKLKEKCPGWYSEMMIVGLAQGWNGKRMRETFEQAIEFEPGYFDFYKLYTHYLLPKWEGQPGEAIAFAGSAADKVGGATGDEIYFHIACEIIGKNGAEYGVKKMDWPRIQRGYQAQITQFGSNRWLKNKIAFFAWKFQDAAFARQQFDVIDNHWSADVWHNRQQFDRARDWARGHS